MNSQRLIQIIFLTVACFAEHLQTSLYGTMLSITSILVLMAILWCKNYDFPLCTCKVKRNSKVNLMLDISRDFKVSFLWSDSYFSSTLLLRWFNFKSFQSSINSKGISETLWLCLLTSLIYFSLSYISAYTKEK